MSLIDESDLDLLHVIECRKVEISKLTHDNEELHDIVQKLLDSLPRCQTYGGEGPNGWGEQCQEVAVMSHPSEVIGDWVLKCRNHPGQSSNEFGDEPQPTRWAAVVEKCVELGFRTDRKKKDA